jgi:tetratricopeptide (TPR) repeat protein
MTFSTPCFWRVFYFSIFFLCLKSSVSIFAQPQFFTTDGQRLTVEMCLEAATKREQEGDFRGASDFLNKAALIHWEKKEYHPAIRYFKESLDLNQKIDNQTGIAGIYSNLGTIYADLEKYDSAHFYFDKSLKIRRKGAAKQTLISSLINSSVVLNNLKRHNEAADLLTEALDLAKETNDVEQMKSCYGMLAETYEKAGDSEKTRYYFDMYRGFHELSQRKKIESVKEQAEQERLRAALLEAEKEKAHLMVILKEAEIKKEKQKVAAKDDALSRLEASYSKQELAMRVLQQETELKDAKFAQQQAENEQQIARQRLWILGTSAILVVVVIASFFVYRSKQQKKAANLILQQKNQEISLQQREILSQNRRLAIALDEIEHKNRDITASITYAKRIQEAMLPTAADIRAVLPESFVFFRPRDLVSGDFYFFHHLQDEKGNEKTILAAVDCTGHGVPGAFMSMIGNEILSRIVKEHKITEPAKILTQLNEGIQNALHQNQTQNRDGMDLALVVIDKKAQTLTFAGAKNPLYYFQNGNLEVLKGDKMPIGGDAREHQSEFSQTQISIATPTTFYLFSDGFQDQFGGELGKKYMTGNFKKLLTRIHTEDFDTQAQILEDELQNWRGLKHNQVDDILVIGAKV